MSSAFLYISNEFSSADECALSFKYITEERQDEEDSDEEKEKDDEEEAPTGSKSYQNKGIFSSIWYCVQTRIWNESQVHV